MTRSAPVLAVLTILAAGTAAALPAQEQERLQLRITPAKLQLSVGESAELKAEVLDVGGRPVDGAQVFFISRARRSVRVDSSGRVTALEPGSHEVQARVAGRRNVRGSVIVTVPYPKPASVEFRGAPKKVYAHTTVAVHATILDEKGTPRTDLQAALESSNPEVAEVDALGNVTGKKPGRCAIVAKVEDLTDRFELEVVANPVKSLTLQTKAAQVRTGDVVLFTPVAKGDDGLTIRDVPVELSFRARPDDNLGQGATGQIEPDGRFVAEDPGTYTVVATCGNLVARRSIKVAPRNIRKRIDLVGHGEVLDVHTSDLWVWQGVDGRDYAVTGTWGANGDAIFWDVTNPARMEEISRVKVDARTVNDVKVSADGKICVLSREGASDRKNGIIVLDVTNPRSPKMLSTYTKALTGGVHNVFIDQHKVYALSAGQRYDVIDIKDPEVPVTVGTFELETPGSGHSIHDVWVTDGIAYSSNWRHGVQLVDVGNGIKGGSPEKPVQFASYAYPSGWNHAAFPYRSVQTGKFYVVAGDENFPYGLNTSGRPTYPRGWFHFIDFTDLANPKEVARYAVPEAGTHNLWIENDILYAAYYNGGVRIVDISGELMGDLYAQGREIGFYLPTHPKGVVPNAPMTWGPQPYKGNVFFSDWNSGLWCVKVTDVPERRPR